MVLRIDAYNKFFPVFERVAKELMDILGKFRPRYITEHRDVWSYCARFVLLFGCKYFLCSDPWYKKHHNNDSPWVLLTCLHHIIAKSLSCDCLLISFFASLPIEVDSLTHLIPAVKALKLLQPWGLSKRGKEDRVAKGSPCRHMLYHPMNWSWTWEWKRRSPFISWRWYHQIYEFASTSSFTIVANRAKKEPVSCHILIL